MLLIEIALAIAAWRRGHGANALRPFGYGFVLALIIGLVTAAGGGSAEQIKPILLLVDVGVIIALLRMVLRDQRKSPAQSGSWQPAPVHREGSEVVPALQPQPK